MSTKPSESTPPKLISTIEYVDNLGQGVDKKLEKITLVPKTLPNEKVEIEIVSSQSKVQWGKISKILSPSPDRQYSPCPHFELCNACHYLHMPYEKEIELKKSHGEHLFKKLLSSEVPLQIISSKNRLHYRNRIQVHYDKAQNRLGFLYAKEQILEVPECQIVEPKLHVKLQELYANASWKKLVAKEKTRGHIELYLKGDQVQISVNKAYADGGFSQVHQEMNAQLKKIVQTSFAKFSTPGPIMDLFGGTGNLSLNLASEGKHFCVDYYQKTPEPVGPWTFVHADLFQKDSLKKLLKMHPKAFSTFIVDPPRSGFKELRDWSDAFRPKLMIYVSCHPQSQLRDIEPLLDRYQLKEIYLLDLFPSTFHFESMMVLVRRE